MDMIKMLKCCLNPKVLIGLAGIAVGIAIFAPHALAAALPLLFVAVCPLSMILMMVMMGRSHGSTDSKRDDLSTLKQRYAKGEISGDQYELTKQQLNKERG
jgi:uncharacterized membrane protein